MGYFKRKLDRKRARQTIRELHDAAQADGEWSELAHEPPKPDRKLSFLRFSIAERHEYSHRRTGVFQAAWELVDGERLAAHQRVEIRRELAWFSKNLQTPDVDVEAAIFLFESDAGECSRRISIRSP